MASYFAPLVLRSNYSLLSGTSPLERIVERAVRSGLSALALTDTDNLYGAVAFYEFARQAGIKPIIGAEISATGGKVVLLARDLTGYSNLCKVISKRNLEPDFSLPEGLAEHQEGLHVLTEDLALAGGDCRPAWTGTTFGSCLRIPVGLPLSGTSFAGRRRNSHYELPPARSFASWTGKNTRSTRF